VFPLLQAHRDEAGATRSWSLLYGLAGMERKGADRTWRLLYFLRFGSRTAGKAVLDQAGRDATTGTTGMDEP